MIALTSGNLYDQIKALARQGSTYLELGHDFYRAHIVTNNALMLLDALGMASGQNMHVHLLSNQAEIYLQKTEYHEARRANQVIVGDFDLTALDQASPADNWSLILALLTIADIDIATSNVDHCGYNIEARLHILRSAPILRPDYRSCICDVILGNLYLDPQKQHNYDLAQSIFERCLTSGRKLDIEFIFRSCEGLIKISLAKVDIKSALRYSIVYLAEGRRAHAWLATHRSLRYLGDVLLSYGDKETAELLFNVALEGFTFSDIHKGMFLLYNVSHSSSNTK